MAAHPARKADKSPMIAQAGRRPVRFNTLARLSHSPNNRLRQTVIESTAAFLWRVQPGRALKFDFASFDRGVLAEALLKTRYTSCLEWGITKDFIFVSLPQEPKAKPAYRKLLIRLVTNSISALSAYKLLSNEITSEEIDQIIKGPYTPEPVRSMAIALMAEKANPST